MLKIKSKVLTYLLLLSISTAGLTGCGKKDKIKEEIISEYGTDSIEYEVLEYILISEKLNKMDLCDEEEIQNMTEIIDSVNSINHIISLYENGDHSFKKYLLVQKGAVNNYLKKEASKSISSKGLKIYKEALKEYYGINKKDEITVYIESGGNSNPVYGVEIKDKTTNEEFGNNTDGIKIPDFRNYTNALYMAQGSKESIELEKNNEIILNMIDYYTELQNMIDEEDLSVYNKDLKNK